MDPKPLARALIGDESRTSLMKNFAHCSGQLGRCRSGPRLLKSFCLACLDSPRFEDRNLAILAAALPSHLRHLELSFW